MQPENIIRGRVDRSGSTPSRKGFAMFNDKLDGCEKVVLKAA